MPGMALRQLALYLMVREAYLSRRYVVQAGDTLASIAAALGIDVGRLAELNHLRPPYVVYAGQVLLVPSHRS